MGRKKKPETTHRGRADRRRAVPTSNPCFPARQPRSCNLSSITVHRSRTMSHTVSGVYARLDSFTVNSPGHLSTKGDSHRGRCTSTLPEVGRSAVGVKRFAGLPLTSLTRTRTRDDRARDTRREQIAAAGQAFGRNVYAARRSRVEVSRP